MQLYREFVMDSWEMMGSIENLKDLNGLDIGSPRYKKYIQIIQDLGGSHDPRKIQETERLLKPLGIKLGVAITLNPSPMPPLESELKYANDHDLKIENDDTGRYRWFKRVPETEK